MKMVWVKRFRKCITFFSKVEYNTCRFTKRPSSEYRSVWEVLAPKVISLSSLNVTNCYGQLIRSFRRRHKADENYKSRRSHQVFLKKKCESLFIM